MKVAHSKLRSESTIEPIMNNDLKQEIEFPTAGLESVPGPIYFSFLGFLGCAVVSNYKSNLIHLTDFITGDGEGGIEMTGSMQLIREFCDLSISAEKITRTRIVIFLTYRTILLYAPSIPFLMK